MSTAVTRKQRWSRAQPCPVCGGYDGLPRGQQIRCAGFLSTDGLYAHCTREERAGGIPITSASGTYAHRLGGRCQCGTTHEPPARTAAPRAGAEPLAVYRYVDEHGEHLYDVCRFAPKTFRCRSADGEWSIAGIRRVLYRLPELAGHTCVYVPEGEKDADRLWSVGLVATCNPHGAKKWTADYTSQLVAAGVREVVILPDADADGETHGQQVASACLAAGLGVKLVKLPGLDEGGDVSDFLATRSPDALLAEIEAAAWMGREAPATEAARQIEPADLFIFEDAGSEYVATWPRLDVSMTLRRLRDHSDGIRGELLITSGGRRLEMLMHSLLAGTSRSSLSKHLAGAEQKITAEMWGAMLRAFAFRVHDEMRRLTPETLTGAAYEGPRFDVFPFALRGELTLLFAPPGTAKSLLAIATGLCHVTGLVLPGGIRPREPLVMKKVLFLDSETTRAAFDHRVGALCRGWGMDIPPADHLHYLNIKGRVLVDVADGIRAYVVRHGISLVILDSTLWVAGHDRELSDATIALYAALASLKVSCLALTHTSKGDGESAYGNVLYEAGSRLVIKVKRLAQDDGSLTVQVSNRKGNDVRIPTMAFRFDFEPGDSYSWVRMGPGGAVVAPEGDDEAPGKHGDRVLKALPLGKRRSPSEIASLCGLDRRAVSATLTRLKEEGLVASDGTGRWVRLEEEAPEGAPEGGPE